MGSNLYHNNCIWLVVNQKEKKKNSFQISTVSEISFLLFNFDKLYISVQVWPNFVGRKVQVN